MNDAPGAARIYDAMLRLYPREFRDEYGAAMSLLFRDQLSDEPAMRVAARAVFDLALTLPEEHLVVHVRRNSTTVVAALYFSLAATGVAVVVIGGTNRATLVLGALLAVTAGVVGRGARRRAATVSTKPATAGWWKLLLAGPVLIATVIVASGLGVEAWYAGMVAVLLGLALFAAGVVLGVVRLFGRRGQFRAG